MTTTQLDAPSIHCTSCAAKIEGHLDGLAGVSSTSVDPDAKRVTVTHDGTVDHSQLITELEELGYPATPAEA